ncbi:uncharacterized protein LOC117175994 [Belonocnema kinseyi]|uniref:uncharacterized protein LOC117175994 n=1 Tax=Belonocnema kinseyi TaxID=2817044 RepID=UPI00143DD4ED|nr:uncharacterized protein LOC117175994 [Belonocnema kinseyi]
METYLMYPLHQNLKSEITYSSLVSQSKMYSTHRLKPNKSTVETMYETKQSSNPNTTKPTMVEPKKGNLFQTAFSSLTNLLVDQLVKVPASLINNLSNVNNTLSVTIVPNEGIISHEFFKSLTSNKDNFNDSVYIQRKQDKEPPIDFVDAIRLNNKVHFPKDEFLRITNQDSKFPVLDDFDLCLDTEPMFLYEKPFDNKEIITNQTLEKEKSESNKGTVKDKVISKDEIIFQDKPISPEDMQISDSSLKESTEEKSPSTTNLFFNMLKRVVNGVTEHFRPISPGSEGCINVYQTTKTRRKPNCVSSGRGRGRGKSQLRRNGVSQTRHRKERCKHAICSDIQDDFDTWEEFEAYTIPLSCLGENEELENMAEVKGPSYSLSFELIDIIPTKTNKERKNVGVKTESFSMQVKYVPECSLDEREANCTIDKTACRTRLISEVSVDSEDSYIVFDTGCDSDFDDFNSSDEEDASESETESESESEPDDTPAHKVRFNLNPTIHKMVKWDFAYRAARLGPWETMARDRERFRGRINHVGRVIEPVLATDFRTKIWNERFATDESSQRHLSAQ